ncbi:MAG: hypothetical protein WD009_05540 [Phycisphaeraceae bacterium]
MTQLHLKAEHKRVLIELYERTERTADDLPYTDEFETLYTGFIARTGLTLTRHDVWRALSSQRKAKRLARKER